jgi:Uma2 family endonuclease
LQSKAEMAAHRLVTAEELLRRSRAGPVDLDHELVRGRLVPVTPAGREHGVLTGYLTLELGLFVRERSLGRVYTDGTGYTLFRGPDTVRGPDVSFLTEHREATLKGLLGFIPGAPDLAIEVRSPDDALAELAVKAAEYLEAGARLVWIVDTPARRVQVLRPSQPATWLSQHDALDGGDVLPGFVLSLARLFAELE